MIRQANNPSGGLGNRLFQLNFLGQIANYLDNEFEFYSPLDAPFFQNVKEANLPFRHRLRRSWNLKEIISKEVSSKGAIFDAFLSKKNFNIQGSYLGETFFRYDFCDPRTIVIPKFPTGLNLPRIACHFRGGDFAEWNKKAILKTEYYLRAIAKIDSITTLSLPVHLVTDDASLTSFKEVREKLSDRLVKLETRHYIEDFNVLANSEYLVSSPSTFSIWAGILGRNQIIHNEDWVNEQAEKEDHFWYQLKNGGNSFYQASYLL